MKKGTEMPHSLRAIRQLLTILFLTSLAASGCRPNSTTAEGVQLQRLGKAYLDYEKARGQGPDSAEGWAKWARAVGDERLAVEIMRECGEGGKYVFYWGVSPSTERDPANTVLAYSRDAPGKGGEVLFCDGVVPSLNASEFARAKKPVQAPAK